MLGGWTFSWQGPHSLSRDTAMHRRLTHTNRKRHHERAASCGTSTRGAESYGRTATDGQATAGTHATCHRSKAPADRKAAASLDTCGDSICLSTTICAREHIVSVRNRYTDVVHAVVRSSGSGCPCGVVFRATLRRPATVPGHLRFSRREVRRDMAGSG